MRSAFFIAFFYFAIVFGLGAVLGTIRVTGLLPRFGEVASVAIEMPFMLAASWIAWGFLLRRFKAPPSISERTIIGGGAFALLIGAELALGVTAFGRSPAQQIEAWLTPAGSLGLAGQALFALFPLIRKKL